MNEMTDVERELAAELAAHPKWDPEDGVCFAIEGHRASEGRAVLVDDYRGISRGGTHAWFDAGALPGHVNDAPLVPDVAHPATQGWLMEMIPGFRRLLDQYGRGDSWEVETMVEGLPRWYDGATKGEALVRAFIGGWEDKTNG